MTARTPLVVASDAPAPCNPAYFDTVFLVPCPPPQWPEVFAVVTAHNPDGRLAVESANNHYEKALDRYLRDQGIESFAVVGASPDLRHHESGRGFAATDLATAAAISARFRQEAFFWIENGVVFLCIDASGQGWKVAHWHDRLR